MPSFSQAELKMLVTEVNFTCKNTSSLRIKQAYHLVYLGVRLSFMILCLWKSAYKLLSSECSLGK